MLRKREGGGEEAHRQTKSVAEKFVSLCVHLQPQINAILSAFCQEAYEPAVFSRSKQ